VQTLKVRDLTAVELTHKLADLRSELFNLRFQLSTGQLRNPMRIGEVRRDIARILTVLKEKGLEGTPQKEEKA
jgi:large subunit ribosomal protein L29